MPDINAIVRTFTQTALDDKMRLLATHDQRAIAATAARGWDRADRVKEMQRWFKEYGVFRGIPSARKDPNRNRTVVTESFLDYADSLGERPPYAFERLEMEATYLALHTRFALCVPPNANNQPRLMASFTSKALWCISPSTVPIYDSRAGAGATVLGRIMGFPFPDEWSYGSYINLWLWLYQAAEQALNEVNLDGYPYRVRIFDKVLWEIGKQWKPR